MDEWNQIIETPDCRVKKTPLQSATAPADLPSEYLPQAEIIKWATNRIKENNSLEHSARLKQGSGKRCLILPFLGEFGHFCLQYVRQAYFLQETTEKIVCLPGKGMECLFPNATSFFYDWEHPIPDAYRMGNDRCERSWRRIEVAFPDYHFVQAGGLSFEQEHILHFPSTRIPINFNKRDFQVDVVIGTRDRDLLPEKNFPKRRMQLIADALTKAGYTFAVIGKEPTAYHLRGEKYFSGDFPDIDAACELISNSKLFFSQDSGTVHLASLVGANIAMLETGDVYKSSRRTLRPFFTLVKQINFDHQNYLIGKDHWLNPDEVAKQILSILGGL